MKGKRLEAEVLVSWVRCSLNQPQVETVNRSVSQTQEANDND